MLTWPLLCQIPLAEWIQSISTQPRQKLNGFVQWKFDLMRLWKSHLYWLYKWKFHYFCSNLLFLLYKWENTVWIEWVPWSRLHGCHSWLPRGFCDGTPVSYTQLLSTVRNDMNQVRWGFLSLFPWAIQTHGFFSLGLWEQGLWRYFQVAEAGDGCIMGKIGESIKFFLLV